MRVFWFLLALIFTTLGAWVDNLNDRRFAACKRHDLEASSPDWMGPPKVGDHVQGHGPISCSHEGSDWLTSLRTEASTPDPKIWGHTIQREWPWFNICCPAFYGECWTEFK